MRFFRQAMIFCLILMMLAMPSPALAGLSEEEPVPLSPGERFGDKDWETVIDEFFQEYDIEPEKVALAYCNTVTGETHFHNGDEYRPAASMYKVALNMYWSEQVQLGKADWDMPVLGMPYEEAQYRSLIDSNNEVSIELFDKLGTYHHYRELVAPYYGLDPETAPDKYYERNFSTAREILHCVQTLYNEPERFPRVLELMLQATPGKYFESGRNEFEVAQKHGYIADGLGIYINSCGIVYTDDPILLVFFSQNIARGADRAGDYCDLMCGYTQYHTQQRLAEEAEQLRLEACLAVQEQFGDTLSSIRDHMIKEFRDFGEQNPRSPLGTGARPEGGSPLLYAGILVPVIIIAAVIILLRRRARARSDR